MKKNKNIVKTEKSAWLFMLPAAIIYLSVIVIPVFYSLYISLFKWNGIGEMSFVGLDNYVNLFSGDKTFHTALVNNLIWIVLTIVVTMTVSLAFAVILNKKFKGRTFFRGFFYFPVLSHLSRWLLSGDGSITPISDLSTSFSRPSALTFHNSGSQIRIPACMRYL